MSFDGLVTRAIVNELSRKLTYGKIEKIYQPEADELVFNVHTRAGNLKLYASCNSSHARVHLAESSFENPAVPLSFCMLLRKHFSGGRILAVSQKETERIIEIEVETLNELGFSVNKKLIFEIMGKHSNIIAVDNESGKIIDCIKRVSIDVNRVRQLLPGKVYEYPPAQDKVPLDDVTYEDIASAVELAGTSDETVLSKALMGKLQGFSPAIALQAASGGNAEEIYNTVSSFRSALTYAEDYDGTSISPVVYTDETGTPTEFHVFPLSSYEEYYEKADFEDISKAAEYYYTNKNSSNRVKQKSNDLSRALKASLDKLYLKKQRLSEDILKAQNSEDYRLYGELLTANIHLVKAGEDKVTVMNYYTGEDITIPLDIRYSASKNAQNYFKKYGKSKTAVKEKAVQLEEVERDIEYLESIAVFIDNANSIEETEELRNELIENGYMRRRKNAFRTGKSKPKPYEYFTSDGYRVLVGRNNKENDILTFKTAGSKDVWFHTKDIPGSHVILFSNGTNLDDLSETAIFEAASLAAYYSKGRASENVPVDYVPIRYVKKPNGAKPGMVIFTNNRTVWTNPGLPPTANLDPRD